MNFRHLNTFLFCITTVLFFLTSSILIASPKYAATKAKLFVPRDGLGNFFEKIDQEKEVQVAYFGGSITAASGWRVQTTKWFSKQFPKAKFHEIHAAVGGTGSDLGAFRLKHDVLDHSPDLVFVEFAVNDGGRSPEDIWKSMEGVVRQIWAANPKTDICFVYTFRVGYEKDLREGNCPRAASAMEMLAEHYGIPSINVALKITELETAGTLIFKSDEPVKEGVIRFSKDGVHPLSAGHEIYTKVISSSLFRNKKVAVQVNHHKKLEHVFVTDNWEDAKMIPVNEKMLSGNWKPLGKDDSTGKWFTHRMGKIWRADKPGSQLSFKFKGSHAAIYDLVGPDAGQVIITVDGVAQAKPRPRFDSYCTYHRIATLNLSSHLEPDKVHTICIEIDSKQPDRKSISFRLKNPAEELKSPKYQGTKIWASQIMIRGEIVE